MKLNAVGARLLAGGLVGLMALNVQADDRKVLAAGSLRLAVTEILETWAADQGVAFEVLFGPSGKLRALIEEGEAFSLFLSASKRHSDALLAQGKVADSRVFTRNALCLMVEPGRRVTSADIVEVMLDPSVRLGTSTPGADPSGDYTWEMFRNIDAERPGAFEQLDDKALKLTGGKVERTRQGLPYPAVFTEDRADVFVSYCTNAVATAAQVDGLSYLRLPAAINVAAVYGMGLAPDADAATRALAGYILGSDGQAILERYGFK